MSYGILSGMCKTENDYFVHSGPITLRKTYTWIWKAKLHQYRLLICWDYAKIIRLETAGSSCIQTEIPFLHKTFLCSGSHEYCWVTSTFYGRKLRSQIKLKLSGFCRLVEQTWHWLESFRNELSSHQSSKLPLSIDFLVVTSDMSPMEGRENMREISRSRFSWLLSLDFNPNYE